MLLLTAMPFLTDGVESFPMWVLERSDFPLLLKEIPDTPERLYVRGTMPHPEYTALCVVGSRALTVYGARICSSLISGLSRSPVVIVSGLALGTDAAAHKAALDAGLPTIAVLPSSVDDKSIYPSSNFPLAQRILKSGGALVSEYRGPTKPQKYSFHARNRIMAGLSKATLIVEATEKSGTMITTRLALDYNRDVMAVPHDIGRPQGAGANRLIRDGAILVRDHNDILVTLGLCEAPKTQTLPTDLTEVEASVIDALAEPLSRDELIEHTQLGVPEVSVALSSLLIRGIITERFGKVERV